MIKTQALMKGNRGMLLLALFFGLLTAVLVVVYLSQVKDEGGSSGGGGAGTVPVAVANRAIAAGTRVTADMVTVKSIPADLALANGFKKADDVVGKVTRVPLATNEQISGSKVAASAYEFKVGTDVPLSLAVPEGMRAVSVPLSNIIGAGGLIRPGDRVDVVLSVKVDRSDARTQLARTLIQNVQVLAIDQKVAPVVPKVAAGGETSDKLPLSEADNDPDATAVTLAVSPIQGEVLAVAATCAKNFSGQMHLALRGFGDEGFVSVRGHWSEDGPIPDCAALMGLRSIN